jgi:hypothetical protein
VDEAEQGQDAYAVLGGYSGLLGLSSSCALVKGESVGLRSR